MLWVLRQGQNGVFFDKCIENNAIYIPWTGYQNTLKGLATIQDFRERVIAEKGEQARTTISNWSGQLFYFVKEMKRGDYVLVPQAKCHFYALCEVIGDYEYNSTEVDNLYHCRKITVLVNNIPQSIFTQQIRYSLGAFRTLFKVRQEEEIISSINEWIKENHLACPLIEKR